MKAQTIVSLITPPLMGAIAVIRLSGEDSLAIAQQIFSKPIRKPWQVLYGTVSDGQDPLDEVLLTYFQAPHSFTGEDVVEISCHGSMLIVQQILALALKKGARLAERGEFTARAFYNGKVDLVQAEAIHSLICASTPEQKKLAMFSLNGKTSGTLLPMIDRLAEILSNIEVNIDYPEYTDIGVVTTDQVLRECRRMSQEIGQLLSCSKRSQYIMHGISVAIVGLPNTGKSSLMNALMDQDKAIVTDIPGTTRDVVEGMVTVGSLPLRLLDTAGIRDSEDVVEQLGIERSKQSIEKADLVLMVHDARYPLSGEEEELLSQIGDKKHILVHNKCDLTDRRMEDGVWISAKQKKIDALKEAILSMFDLTSSDLEPSLCSAREIGLLTAAEDHLKQAIADAENGVPTDLIAVSVKASYDTLKEILGLSIRTDLSEEIFSRFCVGK